MVNLWAEGLAVTSGAGRIHSDQVGDISGTVIHCNPGIRIVGWVAVVKVQAQPMNYCALRQMDLQRENLIRNQRGPYRANRHRVDQHGQQNPDYQNSPSK